MQRFIKENLEIADKLSIRLSAVTWVLLLFVLGQLGLFTLIAKLATGWKILLFVVTIGVAFILAMIIVEWTCDTLLEWTKNVVTFLDQHRGSIFAGRDAQYRLKEQQREQEKAIIYCQNEIAKLKEHTNFARKENLHKVARKLL